jgi:hypothetical protein
MYCSNCGQPVTEGKAFCKNCGAPVAVPEVLEPTVARPPEDQPTAPIAPRPSPPPPIFQAPPPPPPPASFQPPPPAVTGYGQGWQPPPGPPPKGSNTGLIVGIIAAAVVVLAGIGVGTWLIVRDEGTTGTTTVMQTTTTAGPTTTVTTASETTTTSTVTASTTGTSAGGFTEQDYLIAVGEMITRLNTYDTRIPELADEINRTVPDVPQWVYDELNTMMLDLEKAYDDLGYLPLAPGFEDADYWLDEAILYMDDRIYYTLQGIESLWASGDAGDSFDKGRDARDGYRDAMAKFWEVVPAS